MPLPDQAATAAMQYHLLDASRQPWRYGFTSLLRYLAARHADLPQVGKAVRPCEEAFRLGQQPILAFAPRELAQIELRPTGPRISLYGLGMLGPNGPLPLHFTEIAKDRLDNRHDATLVHFLDIFHHRALSHQYRAWAQAQATAGLDRADDEGFARYISRLAGNDSEEIASSPLPRHARLAAAAHLVREARNGDGLVATLRHYFGVPVQLEQHVLHWIDVAPQEHTRLGAASATCSLGEGALLGDMVPDRQHKFRLHIGPLRLSQYLHLTPGGRDLPLLVEWVRAFVGFEYVWDVALMIAADAAPPARLGAPEQLGWSTWLASSNAGAHAVTGMIFEPEHYVHSELK